MAIENSIQSIRPFYRTMILAVFFVSLSANGFAAVPITDMDISDAVQDEYLSDMAVPAELIDIETHNGIVTLSGMVNNILAKERATRIAETVKGVRSVVNTIKVLPPILRSDNDIKNDVENSLLMDTATDSYEIDASVDSGKVTLKGTVDSWQERRLCERVAKSVRGVTGMRNMIEVQYKQARPDIEIKPEIERVLHWNTLIDDALIRVKVKDGKVALSGTVGSAAEKYQAKSLAYVAGVKSVNVDDLKVELWMRDKDLRKNKYIARSDDKIKEAVKDAFIYDPRVDAFNIHVGVDDRRVTLRGRVSNLKERRAAVHDTRNTVGVAYIENRLKVRPQKKVKDEIIEQRIRKLYEINPYVEKKDITVLSMNGIVDLYGSVDSYFEKANAEDLAARIAGVVAVDNNIDVAKMYMPFPYEPYTDSWRSHDYPWYHVPLSSRPMSVKESTLKESINDEFFWSPFVDADEVKVSVEGTTVTLKGKVDSWMEYDAATENAYEGGATAVINNLAVK